MTVLYKVHEIKDPPTNTVYELGTVFGAYRNDSNKRPGHLLNFDFLLGRLKEVSTYSFSHKIWGGQKRHLKKYFVTVAFSLSFPSNTRTDAVSHISIHKIVLL